jgi:SpoIID/LytB domain protein
MRISFLWIPVLLLASAPWAVSASDAIAAAPSKDGFVLTQWGEWTMDEARAALDRAKAAGAGRITVIFELCQDRTDSSSVSWCYGDDYAFTRFDQLLPELRSRGLEFTLLPIVHTPDWKVRQWFWPADRAAWFRSYGDRVVELARFGRERGALELIVGSELTRLFTKAREWRAVIARVRAEAPALHLTISAVFFQYATIRFWDALDSVGISAYFPLALLPGRRPAALLEAAWRLRRAELEAYSALVRKPVTFVEVGYPGTNVAARMPWDYSFAKRRPDSELQRRCFEALRRAWRGSTALRELSIWGLTAQASEPADGFSPIGKSAEAEVRDLFNERRPRALPEFEAFAQLAPAPSPSAAPAPETDIDEVRIQIFPHIGDYTSPEGRDTVTGRVSLQALKGECREYAGPAEPPLRRADFNPPATPLRHAARLDWSSGAISGPLWVECDAQAQLLRVGHTPIRYEGTFFVEKAGHSGIRVALLLPFESYVRGVVPAEMPASWNPEALRVQAVAARSYALFQIALARAGHARLDLDDTVLYQAFMGELDRDPRTDAAVAATEGEVLRYDGRPALAYFSADAGGYTEAAAVEFPTSAAVPYCLARPEPVAEPASARWSLTFDETALTAKLVSAGLLSAGDALAGVSVKTRTQSGRAGSLELTLGDGRRLEVDGGRFRFATALRSRLFSVTPVAAFQAEGGSRHPGGFRFDGVGFGHGVGMSQWGAERLSTQLGWDHRRILGLYYTGAGY